MAQNDSFFMGGVMGRGGEGSGVGSNTTVKVVRSTEQRGAKYAQYGF